MDHRSPANSESMENLSVNGLLVLLDDTHEDGTGSVHWTRKGFGLKKWRRIKRDCPVKNEAAPFDDGSKLLKRGLTDLVNPPSKHVDLSSIEAMQSSEGSVGSVNMMHHPHHLGVANGFSSDSGFMFTLGQVFEKSEEHSSNVGEKIVSGRSDTIKNCSEEVLKADKENLCSSMDSDLRSCDFVFSSGAVSVANHIEKDESLMMSHIWEYNNEGQTYSRSDIGEKDEDGDENKRNNHYWADKDPLTYSIRILAALQEALWKDVQSFHEMGKEYIPNSSDQLRNENCREENSISLESQALILMQKVKHIEHKLKEARTILEAKEAMIQELENFKIESEMEGIFQRKIETEIVHLMLSRSLNSSLQVLNQSKKVQSLSEDLEPNSGNILGKTCKFSFYFLTQLILLVSILRFLLLQSSPASPLIIPT